MKAMPSGRIKQAKGQKKLHGFLCSRLAPSFLVFFIHTQVGSARHNLTVFLGSNLNILEEDHSCFMQATHTSLLQMEM